MAKYTRKQYMNNEISHQDYYLQFATKSTEEFVKSRIDLDRLLKSKDVHLNDVVEMTDHGWLWDYTPFDLSLARELGEVGPRSIPSPSTHTCIGKAMARKLIKDTKGQ